ncbi:MAG: hypothetical protein AVDCRST_MAG90-3438 [uncultured Microvirga sp.]|uniref:Uncharacterized protein n=1 Tax=uncultured Microvirga sp. TaxID=412392 RepID=A0A6J4MTR1_9HYPH|nr:MAG: hypothetical protein AVDCRST_MAG90-3438 [uncultured Microvirga sp.]
MIKTALRGFVDQVVEKRTISAEDVAFLQGTVLPHGLAMREEADMLVALDRAVADADPSWVVFLVASVVDFVVWTSRPTGYVGHDDASWLVATLSCGKGPTPYARRIAFEVIREAEQVDEALLAFALRGVRQHRSQVGADRGSLAA